MKHKLGLIGFSYLAGLICATIFNSVFVFVFAGILLIVALIFTFARKAIPSIICFTAFAAASVYGIYTVLVYEPILSYEGKTAEINGIVSEVEHYSNDTASYVIETNINGVNTSITLFSTDTHCSVGDHIKFSGKLSLLKDNTEFSEESYYKTKGIFLKATSDSSIEITHSEDFNIRSIIVNYSDYVGERIKIFLSGEEGDLLNALFLGDKSGLSYELSNNIKRAGISHFTAVSGLHLTIISHILMIIISLTPFRNRRIIKFSILTALIFIFMIFFKMSVSVIRAGIMLIVFYGADLFMRKGNTLNSLGLAILAITLFRPYSCLDIGLLLSVAGTFGVGTLAPFFCKKLISKRFKSVKSAIIGSLCATICTMPLSCIFFGGFSIIGIFMNMLLYPLFFPALICVTLFALTGAFGSGLMFVAGICSKAMISLINFFGSFKYGYISLDYDFIGILFSAAIIFTAVIYLIFKSPERAAMAIGLSVCVLVGAVTAVNISEADKTKLLMFSDGDDACVIVDDKTCICIFASDDSNDIFEYINEYMQNNFLDKVQVLRLINSTHNNMEAFENIPCDLFSPPDSETKQYSVGKNITVSCGEKYSTITANNISLSISPSADPKDDMISVIYGYKKNIPKMSGQVYCSSRRISEDYNFTNLYYESANYVINENGFMYKS